MHCICLKQANSTQDLTIPFNNSLSTREQTAAQFMAAEISKGQVILLG